MNAMAYLPAAGLVLALGGATRARARTVRRPDRGARSVGSPCSPVRVLRTDDELHDATERALAYDRVAMEALHRRIDRYAKAGQCRAAAVIDLPTRGSSNPRPADQRKATA